MGNYKVSVTATAVNVMCEGNFTPEDAQAFVKEFNKQVSTIKPAQYHLSLDASKLAVSPAEMQELLKGCLTLYKSLGFNKISLNIGTNVILKMQLQRLAKEVGLSSIDFL